MAGASSARLDWYAATAGQNGYALLNGLPVPIPWVYAVGDTLCLYPIAYAARAKAAGAGALPSDVAIVRAVVDDYVLRYPMRLADGTYSRPIDWWSAGFFSWDSRAGARPLGRHAVSRDILFLFCLFCVFGRAVWVDDAYMGTGAAVAAAALTGNVSYAVFAAQQALLFDGHLRDPADGLYYHGLDNDTGVHSCCKWGRGNGWALVAAAEALGALTDCAPGHPLLAPLRAAFVAHAAGVLAVQSPDGRWHQLLDAPTSFLETSATAMFVTAFIEGMARGWLDEAVYAAPTAAAATALLAQVSPSGVVFGVVGETGIGDSPFDYNPASAAYEASAPGLGAVLRALAAIARWPGAAGVR